MVDFMARGVSNHCPEVIKLNIPAEHRPTPFQFLSHLMEDPDYLTVVKEAWSVNIEGDLWFILTYKLRRVKFALKTLNEKVGHLSSLVNNAREAICFFQNQMVNWLKKGDGNNKYFFNASRGRWNTNKVLSLLDSNGEVCYSHEDIARIAVDYYINILGDSTKVAECPDDLSLKKHAEQQHQFLAQDFTSEDVLKTLRKMGKDRSPDPDGFPVEFY
ncbi:uncharacterized protein LOC141715233 [Apium graveolens]|uniref:uncharacterized protein LOC141715233 n=1 Tax=Apium graveolens TaxID=4045 RepID=UPI003D7AF9D7